MQLDDNICYCFGIPMRKLVNFARRTKPTHASRMTECLSAGTGCGWCIPFLIKVAENPDRILLDDVTSEEYAQLRETYRKSGEPRNTFEEEPS